jgi:[acyl-carrier-protein] S-malonyltransferase
MSRVVVAFPGQGAYTAASLGSLPGDDPRVARADELRRQAGLFPLSELDAAERLEPGIHLAPANAWPLTWLAALIRADQAAVDRRAVAMLGNSLGWYTALTAAGALSFDDGLRLVQTISVLQQHAAPAGGQLIYPLAGADWQTDQQLAARVADALAAGNGEAFTSIELGAYVVLAGSQRGLEALLSQLPPVRIGDRRYPMRLALHGPQHTPLASRVAAGC